MRAAESLQAAPLRRSQAAGLRLFTVLLMAPSQQGSPLRGLHGAEMASTATSNGVQRSASRAQPVQRGRGGGGKHGGRRPTCRQGCWPDAGRAAKEEHGLPGTGSAGQSIRRQPCAAARQRCR
ncbi:hypothetical protein [Xenorhabdus lircayensis]|uniref:Uncharacterized protein n=1 Tax=Xenorhabdus lircayensis TaxID=2763499 RepID=A0ABS0U059_9GAMM|nr:hypothetical protein [Xenorhabdus lircayensis]MBI6547246.1 hypothetical protein [Xenorhabdus lircayensis]